MPVDYQELNPASLEIGLNSVTFKLSSFNLYAQSWASNFFMTKMVEDEHGNKRPNGLQVLSERIQDIDDFPAILETTWYLLKKKKHFNDNKEFFFEAVEKLGNEKYLKAMEFRIALNACLGASQPKNEDVKGDFELKKS